MLVYTVHIRIWLVASTYPSENMSLLVGVLIPNRWKTKKCSKPDQPENVPYPRIGQFKIHRKTQTCSVHPRSANRSTSENAGDLAVRVSSWCASMALCRSRSISSLSDAYWAWRKLERFFSPWNLRFWYPPVIKHGLLENGPFISDFLLNPPLSSGIFQLALDDTRGYSSSQLST